MSRDYLGFLVFLDREFVHIHGDLSRLVGFSLTRHFFFKCSHSTVLIDKQLLLALDNLGHDVNGVADIKHFFVNDLGKHIDLALLIILLLLLPLQPLILEYSGLLPEFNQPEEYHHLNLREVHALDRLAVEVQVDILLLEAFDELVV